jgi:hypothetical protein
MKMKIKKAIAWILTISMLLSLGLAGSLPVSADDGALVIPVTYPHSASGAGSGGGAEATVSFEEGFINISVDVSTAGPLFAPENYDEIAANAFWELSAIEVCFNFGERGALKFVTTDRGDIRINQRFGSWPADLVGIAAAPYFSVAITETDDGYTADYRIDVAAVKGYYLAQGIDLGDLDGAEVGFLIASQEVGAEGLWALYYTAAGGGANNADTYGTLTIPDGTDVPAVIPGFMPVANPHPASGEGSGGGAEAIVSFEKGFINVSVDVSTAGPLFAPENYDEIAANAFWELSAIEVCLDLEGTGASLVKYTATDRGDAGFRPRINGTWTGDKVGVAAAPYFTVSTAGTAGGYRANFKIDLAALKGFYLTQGIEIGDLDGAEIGFLIGSQEAGAEGLWALYFTEEGGGANNAATYGTLTLPVGIDVPAAIPGFMSVANPHPASGEGSGGGAEAIVSFEKGFINVSVDVSTAGPLHAPENYDEVAANAFWELSAVEVCFDFNNSGNLVKFTATDRGDAGFRPRINWDWLDQTGDAAAKFVTVTVEQTDGGYTVNFIIDIAEVKGFYLAHGVDLGDLDGAEVGFLIASQEVGAEGLWALYYTVEGGGANNPATYGKLTLPVGIDVPAAFVAEEIIPVGFVAADGATSGNWVGLYGSEGYIIACEFSGNTATAIWEVPAYADVSINGANFWQWTTRGITDAQDASGLFINPKGSSRTSGTYFAANSFEVNIDLGEETKLVSFYINDFDELGRSASVTAYDEARNSIGAYSTQNYMGGRYVIFALSGQSRVVFENIGDDNVTLSGIFFDPIESLDAFSGRGTPEVPRPLPPPETTRGSVTVNSGFVGVNGLMENRDPTNINGGNPFLLATDNGGWVARVILYNDLSSVNIPAGAVIESATLSLFAQNPGWFSHGDSNVGVYRITDDENLGMWVRGTNNDDTQISLDYRSTGVPWVSGGDIYDSVVPSSRFQVNTSAVQRSWVDIDVTESVAAWLGGAVNQGWLFVQEGEDPIGFGFISPEATAEQQFTVDHANKPILTISYAVTTGGGGTTTGGGGVVADGGPIEVDVANPAFTVDWYDDSAGDLADLLFGGDLTTRMAVDVNQGGTDANRYVDLVIPLKAAGAVNNFDISFYAPGGGTRFIFNMYVSNDGVNWGDPLNLGGGVEAFGYRNPTRMRNEIPAHQTGVLMPNPDLNDTSEIVNVSVLNPRVGNYVMLRLYGTDQGHSWISLTSLKLNGATAGGGAVDISAFGTFGDLKTEVVSAGGVTRILVGEFNSTWDFNAGADPDVDVIWPHRDNSIILNSTNWAVTPVYQTLGDRGGALTYKMDAPITSWQVGGPDAGRNPHLGGEIPVWIGSIDDGAGGYRESNRGYNPPHTTVLLHKAPLDYTRPYAEQDGVIHAIRPLGDNDWGNPALSGTADAADGYYFITILASKDFGWGHDFGQFAYIKINDFEDGRTINDWAPLSGGGEPAAAPALVNARFDFDEFAAILTFSEAVMLHANAAALNQNRFHLIDGFEGDWTQITNHPIELIFNYGGDSKVVKVPFVKEIPGHEVYVAYTGGGVRMQIHPESRIAYVSTGESIESSFHSFGMGGASGPLTGGMIAPDFGSDAWWSNKHDLESVDQIKAIFDPDNTEAFGTNVMDIRRVRDAGNTRAETIIPFASVSSFSGFDIQFFNGAQNTRAFYFDIETSTDGVNWTPVALSGDVITRGVSANENNPVRVECYVTDALDFSEDTASAVFSIDFVGGANASYIKFVNYGSSNSDFFSILTLLFR